MPKILLPLLICIVLSACASSPKSSPQLHLNTHFSTIPLNNQSYRIRLQAPTNMSQGTAEEMTLVKSAQLTVQQGYTHFKLLNDPNQQQTPRQTAIYQQPIYLPLYSPYYSRYHANPYFHSFLDDPFFNPPTTVIYNEPIDIVYHIEIFKENIPNDAFDARLILQHLGQKYGVSSTGDIISPQAMLKSNK